MKRPLGVSFISYLYIFGAVVLIITAIFFNPDANEFGIADRFGLPNFPEQPFRIILAVVSLYHYIWLYAFKKMGILVNDFIFICIRPNKLYSIILI